MLIKSLNKLMIMGILGAMFFVSCNHSSKTKVGLVIHSLSNIRWQTDMVYLNKRAAEKNIELIVKVADDDENKQLEQARELLKEGVKVLLVIAVNQNTAAGIVREAHGFGVPVISYDRFIMNSDLDYLVSFHYEEVGQLMIEYATKIKPKGNFVFLWGEPSDANAQFIKDGHIKAMEAYNKQNQIRQYHKVFIEDWSIANTRHEMEKLLEFGDEKIDAIIASNANLALIAINLLEKYNQLDNVVVTAQDISLDTYRLILQGKQTMSVYKPMKELAYTAMDLAASLAEGKRIKNLTQTKNNGRKEVPAILLKPLVVDASNIVSLVNSESLFKPEELEKIAKP